MAYKVKLDYTFTYEREAAYDTPVDSAPVGIPTEDMTFKQEPNTHRFMRAMGTRGVDEENAWNDTFGVFPTASVSVRMCPQIMQELMPGILQDSTNYETVGGKWTMFTNNYADLPSPRTTGDGYFYTLTRNSPDTANDEYLTSAIPTSLKLSIDPSANDGVLIGDFEFIGKDYTREATHSGTITDAPLTEQYQWGEITAVKLTTPSAGETNMINDFVSCEFNITNGAKYVSDLPEGEVVFPKWEVTGQLKVIAGTTTEEMKTLVLASLVNTGMPLVISFGDGTVSEPGEMNITSHIYLTNWESDFEEGEVITFDFEGVFGGAGEYPFKVEFWVPTV